MNWQLIFDRAKPTYYTEFIMAFISLIVIVMYFCIAKKEKSLICLVIIATTSFIETFLANYYISTSFFLLPKTKVSWLLLMYLFIELTCCSLYISVNIQSKWAKRTLLIMSAAVACYMLVETITLLLGVSSLHLPVNTPTLEGLSIIVSCLYFFYESFTKGVLKNRSYKSALWAISGMLLLFTTITPLFLIEQYLRKNNKYLLYHIWVINYVAYCMLFFTFAIAILQQKNQSVGLLK